MDSKKESYPLAYYLSKKENKKSSNNWQLPLHTNTEKKEMKFIIFDFVPGFVFKNNAQ
jgi:hypothetical protein